MPNIGRFDSVATLQSVADVPGLRQICIWKVPIDDSRHIRYMLTAAECAPEDRGSWKERMEAMTSKWNPDLSTIVSDVLEGRLRVEDIDRELLDYTSLEDDLAQCGQGVVWNHKNSTLGRSDVGLILQRKIWARELRALDEGRPFKEWTYNFKQGSTAAFE